MEGLSDNAQLAIKGLAQWEEASYVPLEFIDIDDSLLVLRTTARKRRSRWLAP